MDLEAYRAIGPIAGHYCIVSISLEFEITLHLWSVRDAGA
jgi:hypothetical protein